MEDLPQPMDSLTDAKPINPVPVDSSVDPVNADLSVPVALPDAPSSVTVSPPRVAAPPRLQVAIKRIVARKPVQLLLAFAIIFTVMSWIEFGFGPHLNFDSDHLLPVSISFESRSPAILDNDGYYHIRWARMLRESFPKLPPFKALPLTTLDQSHYVDHHYLFHVCLFPFTFGDLRLGAKWAAVVYSSLGILSLFALLVAYDVRWRWVWLMPIIASSEPFLYRMAMTRAPALSLAMLGLGTYLILKRKHLWLGVLSFAFVWFYSLFPLIFLFALAYAGSVYLAERRFDLWGLLASGTGIVAGLVVNPYFPKNLHLLYEHVIMKTTLTSGYTVEVGNEWYPYESWILIASSAVAFVIYFIGLAAFDFRQRAHDLKPLFFLLVSALLLLMAIKSRRFIEYWPPVAVVFAAFTISPRLAEIDRSWFKPPRERAVAALAAAILLGVALVRMSSIVWEAQADVKSEPDPYAFRGAAEWIAANVPPGEIIFNTNWSDFPMLFYFAPNHAYLAGLDPTYLYDRDRDLWKLYLRITLGEEDHAAPLIRDRFGSEYVFTVNAHTEFLDTAIDSGGFEKVYEDTNAVVLHVRPHQEAPPEDSSQDEDEETAGPE
jgi:hypothetical protein